MSSLVVELAGMGAAVATVLLFLPQAYTAWKNRHDAHAFKGLSVSTIALSFIGAVGWLIYGAGLNAIWTMIPSFINIPLTLFILVLIFRARRNDSWNEKAAP